MNRRIFLAGIAATFAGSIQRETRAGTPVPIDVPEPARVVTWRATLRAKTGRSVAVSCQLAIYHTVDDAEVASEAVPDVGIDMMADISVIGPESVDMPDDLADLPGLGWRVRTFEGDAAAETIYDWIVFRVDRAVWSFEITTWPKEHDLEPYGLSEVVPAIEAVWRRAPDPTPQSLSDQAIDAMLPQADDFDEPLEWTCEAFFRAAVTRDRAQASPASCAWTKP